MFIYSNRNRHLVLKGLVDLAFILMATECRSKTDMHPSWEIGIKILQKIMKIHHETVATVLQALIDKTIADRLHIFQYAGTNVYYNVIFLKCPKL